MAVVDPSGGAADPTDAPPAPERIWERAVRGEALGEARGSGMPRGLRRRYGGPLLVPLRADRPTCIANFVSTIDGVVALDPEGTSGGGEISGFFEPDRFVMGLLRCLADAVLVGAGTVRAAPGDAWVAEAVHPPSAGAFARWRASLGLSAQPTTIVVTTSGDLDPAHPGLADPSIPVIVATTARGATIAGTRGFGPHVAIQPFGTDAVAVPALFAYLASRGIRLVLCEGGPHLLARVVEAGLLDELFLTLSPQLAGRGPEASRLALLEGALSPVRPSWVTMRSVRRAGDHLFLRYGRAERGP